MKKRIFIVTLLFLLLSNNSHAITNKGTTGNANQLRLAFQQLEANANQLLVESLQASEAPSVKEQYLLLALTAYYEKAKILIRSVLEVVAVQSVQVSTPTEAQKIIDDSCLYAINELWLTRESLKAVSDMSTFQPFKEVTEKSVKTINNAIPSIKALNKLIQQME